MNIGKLTKGHPDTMSVNLVAENIEQLRQLFPEVIKEGKVDFDALKDVLGNYADTPEERFQLNWAGKAQARREAQKRSTGTLRPCPEDSVDWDTTQNLYIEGDNLEVLKLLQKSYNNKVKMVYIDPPYNSGKDFVYKDNYTDNMVNYLEITGQDKSLDTNTESDGRYHSNWLNMMYPRLKLAHNLLREDGVIFISIDDNEVTNLKKICDEIFGEENFVASLPTVMNLKGNNDEFGFAGTHEYTLVYLKNINKVEDLYGIDLTPEDMDSYTEDDGKGLYKKGATLMRTGEAGAREKRPRGYYPIYVSQDLTKISLHRLSSNDYEVFPKTKKGKEMSWRRSPETLLKSLDEFIITKNRNNISFYKKQRLKDDLISGKKAKTLFYKPEYCSGNGTDEIKFLFEDRIFDNPKPLSLIKDFIQIGTNEGDMILDFFSGSATTALAVMNVNKIKKHYRKYIMVQLPEPTPKNSAAYNAGYKNICEIGKKRIRLAGKNIKEELAAQNNGLFAEETFKLDIGFKVFKLDSSNINTWDSSVENVETNLYNSIQNIKDDRSEHDLLYEILLKYGIDLVQPINEHTLFGKKVYEMGAGTLIVCMTDHIKPKIAEAIAKLWKEAKPDTANEADAKKISCRVVFKDNGFDDDNDKTNTLQILKQHGINNVVTI